MVFVVAALLRSAGRSIFSQFGASQKRRYTGPRRIFFEPSQVLRELIKQILSRSGNQIDRLTQNCLQAFGWHSARVGQVDLVVRADQLQPLLFGWSRTLQ
jgi:hypothetical protein